MMDENAESFYLDRIESGHHAWWRYIVTLLVAFLIQTLLVIVAAVTAVMIGFPPSSLATAAQDPGQPLVFFTVIGLSFGGLLAGFAVGAAWLHRKSPSDYVGAWRWSLFLWGILSWLALLIVNTLTDYLLQPGGFTVSLAGFVPMTVLVTAASLTVQTFTEEFIFRGWLTQGLLKWLRRPIPTALISGLIFGTCHIPNGLYQAASAAILGIALTLIALRTGSLAFGFGLHMINNIYGAIVVVSGGDIFKGAPGLLTQNTPSLNGVDIAMVTAGLALVLFVINRRIRS